MKAQQIIKRELATAKEAKNHTAMILWSDLLEMSKRYSMKDWSLSRLFAQWQRINEEHNITIEVMVVESAIKRG